MRQPVNDTAGPRTIASCKRHDEPPGKKLPVRRPDSSPPALSPGQNGAGELPEPIAVRGRPGRDIIVANALPQDPEFLI